MRAPPPASEESRSVASQDMALPVTQTAAEPHAGLLTAREIAAFKRDGYFIRRGILSPELCAAARDRLWSLNETRQLDRADGRFLQDRGG